MFMVYALASSDVYEPSQEDSSVALLHIWFKDMW